MGEMKKGPTSLAVGLPQHIPDASVVGDHVWLRAAVQDDRMAEPNSTDMLP